MMRISRKNDVDARDLKVLISSMSTDRDAKELYEIKTKNKEIIQLKSFQIYMLLWEQNNGTTESLKIKNKMKKTKTRPFFALVNIYTNIYIFDNVQFSMLIEFLSKSCTVVLKEDSLCILFLIVEYLVSYHILGITVKF